MLKRAFDLILTAVGLALLSPLLAVLAIVVRCTSLGPVFFRQERLGRNGRAFMLVKFRTMRKAQMTGGGGGLDSGFRVQDSKSNNDQRPTINDQRPTINNQRSTTNNQQSTNNEARSSEDGGRKAEAGAFDAGDISRVTPLGRILRRWKLDELPQLWNVLTGDMSLVGPRPEVRTWVDAYPERWARVLTVRPGITDPASIVYRNEEDILAQSPDPQRTYREEILPHKLSLYEDYVKTQSFRGDVGILLKTLWIVVRGED